jgi:hypothetical protein
MLRVRAKKAGLVLGVVVAALVVSEHALRAFAPLYLTGNDEAYQYDAELGLALKPGIHLFKVTDHEDEIRTGALGTVGFQDDFRGYPALIFALGDSYTQGTGLPADAAYPFQLDLMLNRDASGLYAKRYGVVNLGLAAFGGEQSLLTLRRFAGRLGKPAYALYLGSDNDYDDDLLFRSGYRHHHLVDGSPYWGRWLGPARWALGTEIGKRLKVAVGALRRRNAGVTTEETLAAGDGPSVAELEAPVLERLLAACREQGATPIVSWSSTSPSYAWLRSWARDRGVAFADWAPTVEAVEAAVPSVPVENHHSAGHLRGWVLRAVAEAYRKQIDAHPALAIEARRP